MAGCTNSSSVRYVVARGCASKYVMSMLQPTIDRTLQALGIDDVLIHMSDLDELLDVQAVNGSYSPRRTISQTQVRLAQTPQLCVRAALQPIRGSRAVCSSERARMAEAAHEPSAAAAARQRPQLRAVGALARVALWLLHVDGAHRAQAQ